MSQARQLHLNGLVVIDRWRSGDPQTHCTHCDVCGHLFRSGELSSHRNQAHLGGRAAHDAHKDQGCRLLTLLAAGINRSQEELDAWVETELRPPRREGGHRAMSIDIEEETDHLVNWPDAGTWVSAAGDPPLRVEEVQVDYDRAKLSDGEWYGFGCLERVPEPMAAPRDLVSLEALLADLHVVREAFAYHATTKSHAALDRLEAYIRMTKQ